MRVICHNCGQGFEVWERVEKRIIKEFLEKEWQETNHVSQVHNWLTSKIQQLVEGK